MTHLKTNSKVTAILMAVIFFLFTDISAQNQIRTYNLLCNNNSGLDNSRSIINNLEGGYTLAGFSYGGGCGIGIFDWMFLQLQPNGNHIFAKLYGTFGDDKCNSVTQNKSDSTYLLAGFMQEGNNFLKKATMLGLDRTGGYKYGKMIDDTVASEYTENCIDSSKKNVFTGWKEQYIDNSLKKINRIIVTKYFPSGIMDWGIMYHTYNSQFNIKHYDEAQSICFQSSDNTYGVASRTNIHTKQANTWDIMVTKLNGSGGVIWNKTYQFDITATTVYPSTEPRKIIPMPDGGFVITGFTNRYVQNETDIIVMRVNAAGNLMWSGCYGNTSFFETGQSIVLDGNELVLTGAMNRSITASDAYIMKIPVTGGLPLWTRVWNRTNNLNEGGFDIVRSTTGAGPGYAVTGDASYNVQDAFLWRVNTAGIIPGSPCNDALTVPAIVNEHRVKDVFTKYKKLKDKFFTPVIEMPQVTNVIRCMETDSFENNEKEENNEMNYNNGTDNNGNTELNSNGIEITDFALSQNYPNPFNPTTKIMYDIPVSGNAVMKIFNMAGKEVMTLVNGTVSPGRYEAIFDGSNLSSGIYYYRITVNGDGTEFTDVKKMILVK